MKVVGTGFGRTGTESMRLALNRLGLGPTHHMHEVMANPGQRAAWRAMAKGEAPQDWDHLFAGYNACVDWPSAFWWREIVAHYRDAKVLLTLRSPESWWESFSKTILPVFLRNEDPDSLILRLPQDFGGDPADRATAIAAFERNTRAVIETVPAERLLVYELGSGWEPLCAFLGVEVPAEPYPRSNAPDDFNRRVAEQSEDG